MDGRRSSSGQVPSSAAAAQSTRDRRTTVTTKAALLPGLLCATTGTGPGYGESHVVSGLNLWFFFWGRSGAGPEVGTFGSISLHTTTRMAATPHRKLQVTRRAGRDEMLRRL